MSYLQRGFGPLCTTIKPVNKVVVHGRLQLNSVVSQCHQQTERERGTPEVLAVWLLMKLTVPGHCQPSGLLYWGKLSQEHAAFQLPVASGRQLMDS